MSKNGTITIENWLLKTPNFLKCPTNTTYRPRKSCFARFKQLLSCWLDNLSQTWMHTLKFLKHFRGVISASAPCILSIFQLWQFRLFFETWSIKISCQSRQIKLIRGKKIVSFAPRTCRAQKFPAYYISNLKKKCIHCAWISILLTLKATSNVTTVFFTQTDERDASIPRV